MWSDSRETRRKSCLLAVVSMTCRWNLMMYCALLSSPAFPLALLFRARKFVSRTSREGNRRKHKTIKKVKSDENFLRKKLFACCFWSAVWWGNFRLESFPRLRGESSGLVFLAPQSRSKEGKKNSIELDIYRAFPALEGGKTAKQEKFFEKFFCFRLLFFELSDFARKTAQQDVFWLVYILQFFPLSTRAGKEEWKESKAMLRKVEEWEASRTESCVLLGCIQNGI